MERKDEAYKREAKFRSDLLDAAIYYATYGCDQRARIPADSQFIASALVNGTLSYAGILREKPVVKRSYDPHQVGSDGSVSPVPFIWALFENFDKFLQSIKDGGKISPRVLDGIVELTKFQSSFLGDCELSTRWGIMYGKEFGNTTSPPTGAQERFEELPRGTLTSDEEKDIRGIAEAMKREFEKDVVCIRDHWF